MKPVPSLFTFKIDDFQLVELSGVILLSVLQDMLLINFQNWEYLPFLCVQYRVSNETNANSDLWIASDSLVALRIA